MQIDQTTSVSGGPLVNLDLEMVELMAELTPIPVLTATVTPTTVSISHMFIDSQDLDSGGVDPDPDGTCLFYGRCSDHLGFGGGALPTYRPCYPIVESNLALEVTAHSV